MAKINFCFLSENECLDGMELVYIYIYFFFFLSHKHSVIELSIFCIFEEATCISLPL